MYLPLHFREERESVLQDFIEHHPLATLVTYGSEGLEASHIPLLIEGDSLIGHVARGNAIWKNPGCPALAIFTGPEHYISPNWYPSKKEHGKVVPTWNYAAVHAYGTLRVHDDRDWLLRLVARLTETHEAQFAQPWKVSDAPPEYIEGLLKGIVGVEISVDRVQGGWKMSQNRPEADRKSTADALRALGSKTADLMDHQSSKSRISETERPA